MSKNTIAEWDKLAAESINSVLAPKGFEKMKSGSYRGSEKSKGLPFLSKQRVIQARGVAAMMVRRYRELLKEDLTVSLNGYKEQKALSEATLKVLWWWKFKERKFYQEKIYHFRDLIIATEIAIARLEVVKPK